MSKGKARFTVEQMDSMGLEPDGNGGWRPREQKTFFEKVSEKLDFSEPIKKADFKWDEDGKVKAVENPDGRFEIHTPPSPIKEDVYVVSHDPIKPPPLYDINGERMVPYDIASVRALNSGTKARLASMDSLHQEAKKFLLLRKEDVYIKGNTASSKNSKDIGFYYKGSGPNKKKVNILVDSKLTKAYRKSTEKYWTAYKQQFLNSIEGKPFPLMIEFTFIRKQLNRFDLINAAQIICDLMTDNGWIPDDSSEYIVPVFNPVVYYSPTLCGCVIKVL